LSILIFLLPSDSSDKITLGVTILLAFYVNSVAVADFIPEASSEMPVIGLYYTFNIIFVALSLTASILILNINDNSQKKIQVPNWLKCVLFLKSKNNKFYKLKVNNNVMKKNSNTCKNQNDLETTSSSIACKKSACSCLNKLDKHLIAIYRLLKTNLKKVEIEKITNENNQECVNDWLQIARRLECLFFFVSFVTIIITPVYLFGQYFTRDFTKKTLTQNCGCQF
jgi:hypothetical protein